MVLHLLVMRPKYNIYNNIPSDIRAQWPSILVIGDGAQHFHGKVYVRMG